MTDIERILQADRIWCAYALADLQPQLAPFCRWIPVRDAGLVLLFDQFSPPVLFATGSAEIVAEALVRAPLPERVYLHVGGDHLSPLSQHYDFREDLRPVFRLRLTHPETVARQICATPVRLDRRDGVRIRKLYQQGGAYTPDAFSESQLDYGVFFGLEADGELIAVGGTHILDVERGLASIGNMYTHPEHRGQGHATAILTALVRVFAQLKIQTVIMNVDERNVDARRLYEQLGFEVYCSYWEGMGVRNDLCDAKPA